METTAGETNQIENSIHNNQKTIWKQKINNNKRTVVAIVLVFLVIIIVISFAIAADTKKDEKNDESSITIETSFSPSIQPTASPTTSSPTSLSPTTSSPTSLPTQAPVTIIASSNETTVTVPDVIELIFPAFAFSNDTSIDIFVLNDPVIVEIFDETTILHRSIDIENITDNQMHIVVNNMPISNNITDNAITTSINIPDDIINACPVNYGFEIFASVHQGSSEEDLFGIFVLFESEYNSVDETLTAELPTSIFYNNEASIIISCTPGGTNVNSRRILLASSNTCKASSLLCPVDGGCEVTSPFSTTRTINGVTRPHYGTDYKAAQGTNVFAAADGIIRRSYTSPTYGQAIIIRHSDGSATLYAHLLSRLISNGNSVKAGDIIGTSGNSGHSTGPHLHFEFVPNGAIFNNKNRVDADPCIGVIATGSITVGDSGSAADDAFRLAIDGYVIGETSIGASNNMAVNNLVSGNHELTLTVTVAPDDAGTYTVTLLDGWLFEDGSDSKTGAPPQGTVETWTFTVP